MVEQQQQPQQQQQQPQQQQQQSNALSTSPAKSHLATWWRQFKNSPKSISTDSISNRSTNQHYPGRYGGGNGSKYNDRPALNKPHSTNAVITSTMSNDLQHNKDFKSYRDSFLKSRNDFTGQVFGVPLSQSLSLASAEVIVQSELANFGRIPIVVAKCGAFLKQNGLYTSGIFRIAGNNKRIKELVYIFSTPPNYGTKFSNWDGFTVHDAASVLRRFLNNLTEPLIPLDHYETYREPLRSRVRILKHMKRPASAGSSKIDDLRRSTEDGSVTVPSIDSQSCEAVREEDEERKRKQLRHRKRLTRDIKAAIKEYEVLFSELSNDSKQLIVYLLDLLSLFAQQSDVNLMTARNLAAIFQPSILSHLDHDMDPQEYELSRFVIEFLIDYSYRLLPHLLKITKNEQAVLQKKVRHGSGGVQKEKPSSRSRVVSDNTGVTKVAPTNHPTLQATNGQSSTISDIRKLPQISDLEGNMNQLNLNTSHSTPVTMLGNVTKVNDNEVKQPPVESASHSHEKQGQFISTHPPQALHQYPQHQKQMQQQTPHNYPPQQKPQHQYHQQQHINQHHPQQMQLPKLQTQLHGIQPLQQLHQHHLHKNAGTVPSSQSEIQNRKRFRPHSKSLSSAISPSDMISAWRTHQTSRFGKAVPLGSDTEGMSEYDEDEEIQGVHDEQSPSSNVSNTAIRNKTVSIHKPHNALRPVSVCSKATSRPCSFVINASEETNPISTSTKRSVSSHYPENLLSVPRSDDELEACQTSHPRNIEGDVYPRSDRPSRSNKRDSWFQRLRSRSRSASKK